MKVQISLSSRHAEKIAYLAKAIKKTLRVSADKALIDAHVREIEQDYGPIDDMDVRRFKDVVDEFVSEGPDF